jgi:hypothetical protein
MFVKIGVSVRHAAGRARVDPVGNAPALMATPDCHGCRDAPAATVKPLAAAEVSGAFIDHEWKQYG